VVYTSIGAFRVPCVPGPEFAFSRLRAYATPMRIPKFWARASRDGFEAAGWSFTSIAEALRVAQERVGLLIDVLVHKHEPQGRYLYGDRPVREPVVLTLGTDPNKPEALVTRNAYGALCLNTEDVAFIDVDADRGQENQALGRIRAAHAANPSWAFRIYRTRAGFRVAAVHARIAPGSADAVALFDALGADPLYRKLCAAQASFRARLSPKPWRIGMRRIPGRFPWRDQGVERAVNEWTSEYDAKSPGYAVCELVESFGHASLDPVIDRVLKFHDGRVLQPGKPLA